MFKVPFKLTLAVSLTLCSCVTASPALGEQSSVLWPIMLRNDFARVARLEWRLRSAAGVACPKQASDAGVVFDDRLAYDKRDWPLLEAALGLREHPVVAAIVPGGPADIAGMRAGDEVISIGGQSVDAIVARRNPGKLIADALVEEIAEATPDAELPIVVHRDGQRLLLKLRPVSHCAARFVLFTGKSVDAFSDNRNVAISIGMVAFAQTDDELALAAGHELAHIIAGDRAGAGISTRRRMEEAADELGLRLMECAGYDRVTGIGLFERLGKRDWLGFLRAPTHRSWPARVATLLAQPADPVCPVVRQ